MIYQLRLHICKLQSMILSPSLHYTLRKRLTRMYASATSRMNWFDFFFILLSSLFNLMELQVSNKILNILSLTRFYPSRYIINGNFLSRKIRPSKLKGMHAILSHSNNGESFDNWQDIVHAMHYFTEISSRSSNEDGNINLCYFKI